MELSHITTFVAGSTGKWEVTSLSSISGLSLPSFYKLDIASGDLQKGFSEWILKGLSSNIRYTNKEEIDKLKAVQPGLGRIEATLAAMIPIKKSDEWWNLAQDERRKIMEEQSSHIKEGMNYLPSIARKLYHSKDLGEQFDFITWFEFAPENENAFNDLLQFLRNSPEWKYVIREVDIRFKLSNNLS